MCDACETVRYRRDTTRYSRDTCVTVCARPAIQPRYSAIHTRYSRDTLANPLCILVSLRPCVCDACHAPMPESGADSVLMYVACSQRNSRYATVSLVLKSVGDNPIAEVRARFSDAADPAERRPSQTAYTVPEPHTTPSTGRSCQWSLKQAV